MAGRVQILSLGPGVVQDTAGNTQLGAKVMIYVTGTTTPVVVYQDGVSANVYSQPLLTDREGEIPGFLAVDQVVDFSVNGGPVKQVQVPTGVITVSDLPPSVVNDSSGVLPEGRRVFGSLNRPRVLPPSLGAWNHVGQCLATQAATWKSLWAGYGIDVVWDPQTQRLAMLYGGHDGTYASTGLAYSDDGISWADYGSNPVLAHNPTNGQPDYGGAVYLSPVYEGGSWYGYYLGFASTGQEQGASSICLATAPSLTGPWTRQGAKITAASFPGGSGVTVLYRPTVVQVGQTWYMFTNAGPSPGDEDIWYFTAPSITGPWTVGSQIISGDLFGGAIISDPEILRYGDTFLMVGWSTNGTLQVAYCDVSEFPTTWHANPTAFLTSPGGLYRPCLVQLPSGGLGLYVNANSSTTVDLWVPKSAIPPGAQPSKWHDSIPNGTPAFAKTGTWATIFASGVWGSQETYNTAGAINDMIQWIVDLSAGTWSLSIGYGTGAGSPIGTVDISFDGTNWQAIGTFDAYAASNGTGRVTFTGINVPKSGPAFLRFRALSKNASATGYYLALCTIDFARTA